MLDNLSSFRVHFTLAFLFFAILFLVRRKYFLLAASCLGLIANVAVIVPWFLSPADAPDRHDDLTLRLVASNVSPRNRNPAALVDLVDRENPDILGLIELTPDYLEGLNSIQSSYPYKLEAPQAGFYGLALYSKLPLKRVDIVYFGEGIPPSITAIVQLRDSEVELLLLHPHPPSNRKLATLRNLQLQEIAKYIRTSKRPTIVLADLNVALWSPFYVEFVQGAGLVNARRGHGPAGTWPPSSILGVPIDHILHSPGIVADDFEVLQYLGSDHLPIAATLRLKSSAVEGHSKFDTNSTAPVADDKL